MKYLLYSVVSLFISFTAFSQQTGVFFETIQYNGANRRLHYYVPQNYNANNQYKLVVGLHGCAGGTEAIGWRDALQFLGDSINAVIVCPEGLMNGFMGEELNLIAMAMDTTRKMYSIDSTNIFLTGFSCNGFTTAYMGTRFDTRFRGIIPFNAALLEDDFASDLFNYSNSVSTCVCVGSADPALGLNFRLYDSLRIHKSKAYYNELPGIGHTYMFNGFENEMMECFRFFGDDIVASAEDDNVKNEMNIIPNPVVADFILVSEKVLKNSEITISDIYGKTVYHLSNVYDSRIHIRDFNVVSGMYNIRVSEGATIVFERSFIKL